MLALLLVEPLLAWNFRQGFVVLCALAITGLGFLIVPGHPRYAAAFAVVLGGGLLAAAAIRWWRGAPSPRSKVQGQDR